MVATAFISRRENNLPVYAVMIGGTVGNPDLALETFDRSEAVDLRDRLNSVN